MKKRQKHSKGTTSEITTYDTQDVTEWVDTRKPLTFEDLGIELPPQPPTQVVSIRLPTRLLNEIRALGSQQDVPYQSLIKLFLAEAIRKEKKRAI